MNRLVQQQAHFEALYAASPDPWHVRDAWYEQRKRAVLLASLPKPRYEHVFEPGCGNGELTAALAPRCARILACDGSASAVAAAQQRLSGHANAHAGVTIDQRSLPLDWPRRDPQDDAGFDLIVVSELAYYFAPEMWQDMLDRIVASLASGGLLLLCHWRHAFDDRVASTAAVHDTVHAMAQLTARVQHTDTDFLLDGWLRA